MRIRERLAAVTLAIGAAALLGALACGGGATAPDGRGGKTTATGPGGDGTGEDTSSAGGGSPPPVPPPEPSPTPPPDTGSTYHGPVTITGRVLAVTIVAPGGGAPDDTLKTAPLAGVVVRVERALPSAAGEPGPGTLVAETTTGADGAYSVAGVPAGDYVLRARAPDGSGLRDAWEYLSASGPEVTADVYLWAAQ